MRGNGWRGFPLYWTGRASSQFGDQITLLALPWLVAEETASPLAVGAVEALMFVPVLLFGLPIGAIADARSRRRSMIEADIWRLALVASLPVAAAAGLGPSVAHMLIAAFLIGFGSSLFEASEQGFLPDLVPREELVTANSRLSFTEGLAEIAGPATGGFLIAGLGAAGALAIDALTFGISALALAMLVRVKEGYSTMRQGMSVAIREGVRYLMHHPQLRTLTLLASGINLGAGVVAGVLVLFLQETIGLGGLEAGLFFAVNGAGGVAASLACPPIARRIGLGRTVLAAAGFAAIGNALIAATTASTWFAVGTIGTGLVGLGVVTAFIASATLRQYLIPSGLVGRVTSAYRTLAYGAVVVGALVGGGIGEVAGIREALILGAAIYTAVCVGGFFSPLNAPDLIPNDST